MRSVWKLLLARCGTAVRSRRTANAVSAVALLKGRESVAVGDAGGFFAGEVKTDYTSLVGAIAQLTGETELAGDGRDQELAVALWAGAVDRQRGALGHVVVGIATFLMRRGTQDLVDQDRPRARGRERTAQSREAVRKAVAVGRRVNDRSVGEGANILDGGGLIGHNSSVQQVRNSDGRDDQNDGHHNQQFDEGETACEPPRSVPEQGPKRKRRW